MSVIDDIKNSKTISRVDLLGLRAKVEAEKKAALIDRCVEAVKNHVIEVAQSGHATYLWKDTMLLIMNQFGLQACEITDQMCDEISIPVISKLKEIFPDCSINREIMYSMFGKVISDHICIVWR